jgi:hypothetical protein
VSEQLDEGQRKVLPKIEALLRLADRNKNSSPAEAASAAAKAQELLLAYNLDASLIGSGGEDGRREEAKLKGGVYQYQRDLWSQVADLNFCLYFTSGEYVEITRKRKRSDGSTYAWKDERWEARHRLIGKRINVIATVNMAQYLQDAIERLVMERLGNQNNLRFSNFAVSYREGAASTIINKLYERRKELIADEERREREAHEKAEAAGRKGVSTETALTIASVEQTERDANMDHLMGEEGWSARKRSERAAEAQRRKEARDAYTRWAEENPEEAREQARKAREEDEKREARNAARRTGSYRGGGSGGKDVDRSAYYAGRDAASKISLDPQMGGGVKGALG